MSEDVYVADSGVTCCAMTLTAIQLEGLERGSVEWAEARIVELGILNRRTKLKRLSAKTIASIVERLADAEDWRDNHECYQDRWDDY